MIDVKSEMITVAGVLDEARIDYALCGGLAMAVHGFPRATQDIDFIVCADDLAAIRTAIKHLGFKLNAGVMTFGAGTDDEVKMWRVSRVIDTELASIDFILVNRFLEDVWNERVRFDFGDARVNVVSVAGLRKMKRAAGRSQDLADLENLNDPDIK